MKRYSCAIIDNNVFFKNVLSEFISKYDELELKELSEEWCYDKSDAVIPVDIIFYDPGILGDCPKKIAANAGKRAQLVIISSEEEYAIQAMRAEVTDFLEKSLLTQERFEQTLLLIKSKEKESIAC